MDVLSRARGCMIGAAVGDAAGALLEWEGAECPVTTEQVDWAMGLPAGGPHQVAPGQITDDTEQQLSLATGLALGRPKREPGTVLFDVDAVAREYSRWCRSNPFDLGAASRNAFGSVNEFDLSSADLPWAATMRDAARRHNSGTKSNGALMRCMPLAVWGHKLSASELVAIARADAELSHPNPACVDAVAAYVMAAAHLIRGDTAREACEVVRDWANSDDCCGEVRSWLIEAMDSRVELGFRMHTLDNGQRTTDGAIAFCRWGVSHAFRHLALGSSWETAVRAMLLGGGDTDTHAAIVGGLVGALHGDTAVPAAMVATVLHCDTAANLAEPGVPRPDFLRAGRLEGLVHTLLESAPESCAPRKRQRQEGCTSP